jgi:hypothetical protein
MILRICVDGREQVVPASDDLVERAFAPEASVADGTEITLAEGERWLAALAVGSPGGTDEFLLSGAVGETPTVSGQTDRAGALRRFREFLARADAEDGGAT